MRHEPKTTSPIKTKTSNGSPEVDVVDIDHPTLPDADPGHKAAVDRIRRYVGELADRTQQIGDDLLRVKADLKRRGKKGAFLEWLDENFGWTARTAQRFMRFAEFCQKYPEAEALPPSVVILLAASTTPAEVIAAILVEKRLGACPTRGQVKQLIDHGRTLNPFQLAAMAYAPLWGTPAAKRRYAVAQNAAELILLRMTGSGQSEHLRKLIDQTDAEALMRALRDGLAADEDDFGSEPAPV